MSVEDNVGYFRAEQPIDLDSHRHFVANIGLRRSKAWCGRSAATALSITSDPLPLPEARVRRPLYKGICCPVEFNSDRLEWQFDATSLYSPLPTANTITLQMCLKSCDDMLAKVSASTSFKEKGSAMLCWRDQEVIHR